MVPVMAMGVAELKRELAQTIGIDDLPDIHQVLSPGLWRLVHSGSSSSCMLESRQRY